MNGKERLIRISGGLTLTGEVSVDGSKNASLACLAASALVTDGSPVELDNVPDIADVRTMMDILRQLGKKIEFSGNRVTLSGSVENRPVADALTGSIRGSTYCLGLLLATCGEATVGLPGGDNIGDRPIDIHLDGFCQLGARVKVVEGRVYLDAPDGLTGDTLFLRYPSVGATCNLMIAAAGAEGRTVIQNAAKEPEIVDLANLLVKMGIRVVGAGSDNITIHGGTKLHGHVVHEVIPDRIETGVLLTALAITGGEGKVINCTPYHNHPLLSVLERAGFDIQTEDTAISLKSTAVQRGMRVTALPYPGLATDLQPLLTVLALRIPAESTIADLVFPERFGYVYELSRLGARIQNIGNGVRVQGGVPLGGRQIEGRDIRSVTALICAGLLADGVTEVSGVGHMERGYRDLPGKLRLLGADVSIV